MGYLVNNTCFETNTEARDQAVSMLFSGSDYIVSGTVLGNVITLTTNTGVYDVQAPTCTYVGLRDYWGITPEDSIETAWLVASILLSAWAILIIKRTF